MFRLIACLTVLLFSFSLPASAQGEGGCAHLKDFWTKSVVRAEFPPPVYDFSKTIAVMNKDQEANHQAWLAKNHMEGVWQASEMETEGYAAGAFGIVINAHIHAKRYDPFATLACPYIDDVTIGMMYRTIIAIPLEYPKDSCKFKVVMIHELKHHMTNVGVAKAAVEKLRKDMPRIIAEIEERQPYVRSADMPATYKAMDASLQDLMTAYLAGYMKEEMTRLNTKIDSPEEYKASAALMRQCDAQ